MTRDEMLCIVRAAQGQEMEEAKTWMAKTTDETMCAIWCHICEQQEDEVDELVMRLACLGFAEAYIRWYDQGQHKTETHG